MAQRNTYREDEELEEQINFRDILRVGKYLNPQFPSANVALVVGANDVTNPAARGRPARSRRMTGVGRWRTMWWLPRGSRALMVPV